MAVQTTFGRHPANMIMVDGVGWRTRVIPALIGQVMAASLLIQAAHWSSEVAGGGLAATTVLAVAAASGRSRWSLGRPENHAPGGKWKRGQ